MNSTYRLENQPKKQLQRYISRWDRRLRLTQLALWVPRGLIIGLILSILIAVISRWRPWLLPPQILTASIVLSGLAMALAAITVLGWRRSVMHAARYFDRVFGLKERSSAALEIADGLIKTPDQFADLQIKDAVKHAQGIQAARFLRFQWRRRELQLAALLIIIVGVLLWLPNPQTTVIAQQNAIQSAITKQVQQLQQIKTTIENNPKLSDAEKAQLNKIIDDTINKLEQPNVSPQEALAAMSSAQQQLAQSKTQLSPDQKSGAQQAGQALNQNPVTQNAGQALQSGNLSQAASELQNLANKVGDNQLTQQQQQDTANSLSQAAQNLQSTNPQAAQDLQQAANALKSGDTAGAQNALQNAANALNQQQNQLNQSAISQASQNAAQQMQQGQQQISQASQQGNQQSQQQGQQGQQSGQQGNQQGQQQGQQNQSGQGQNQQGQQGQQGQGSQQGQQGQQSGQQDSQQGQQQGQQGNQSGQGQNQQGQGSQQGQQGSQQSNQSGQQGNQPGTGNQSGQQAGQQQGSQAGQSQGSNGQSNQGSNNNGSGVSSGSAGDNTTTGNPGAGGPIPPNNGHSNGDVVPYEGVYAPSFVGGQGGTAINPKSDNSGSPGSGKSQDGTYASNPSGQSTVALSDVAPAAAASADQAMDADHVPGILRGVIRDYFAGLQSK